MQYRSTLVAPALGKGIPTERANGGSLGEGGTHCQATLGVGHSRFPWYGAWHPSARDLHLLQSDFVSLDRSQNSLQGRYLIPPSDTRPPLYVGLPEAIASCAEYEPEPPLEN